MALASAALHQQVRPCCRFAPRRRSRKRLTPPHRARPTQGTSLESSPAQPLGGGINSTVTVALPGGALAPNNSINVQFVVGVEQQGSFRFIVNES